MTTCDFISGVVSGMANVIVGHPFDTVKVNEQTLNSGTFRAISNIYGLHGIKGYFRGILFPLVTSGFQNAIFFSSYELILQTLNFEPRQKILLSKELTIIGKNKEPELRGYRFYQNCFLAGVCAGAVQSIPLAPVEMVKTNLQATKHLTSGKHQFMSTYSMVRFLLKENGLRTFYQGYTALLLRDLPSLGVYMTTYSIITDLRLFKGQGSPDLSHGSSQSGPGGTPFLEHFFAGGTAGTLAWWVSIPPDVLKSKIETDDPRKRIWSGLMPCARHIYKQNGIRGFFVGFWTITVRAFPVNGAVFMAYEFARQICKSLNVQD